MSEDLPEFYIADNRARISQPTYEALAPCQIIMVGEETGLSGPTIMAAGDHFTTDAVPCHQWKPLNRAAAERYEQWLATLPLEGKNVTMEHITEAARMLAPKAGDPDFPHEVWSQHVMVLAAKLAEKRHAQLHPSIGFRPMANNAPPMPFAMASSSNPADVGRPPAATRQASPDAPRRARPGKPMPNANMTDAPAQTASS